MILECIAVGLMVSFFIILSKKWGLSELIQAHAPTDFIYRLVTCNFCIGFWWGVTFGVASAYVNFDPSWLIAPLIIAPIVKVVA